MRTEVLDHGYVLHIESWGSDERIIEAARMSTDKGFQGWGPFHTPECYKKMTSTLPDTRLECSCNFDNPGDEKLLKYLYEHKHMTPFEMGGLIIEVQAPIFVFREWHRHRTQSYNELSARYTELPDLFYVPDIKRIQFGKQAVKNKQSSDESQEFTYGQVQAIRGLISSRQTQARDAYESLLTMGVAREIARVVIPVSQYSRMRASANLRNWLAFLTLRMDKAAQWEIRQYAIVVGDLIKREFPRTWELFQNTSPQG